MNSLSDLNRISNQLFQYADARPATIEYNRATAINQSVTAYEGRSFQAPSGVDLTKFVNADALYVNFQSNGITYTKGLVYQIDMINAPGVSVSWGNTTPVTSATGPYFLGSNVGSGNLWMAHLAATVTTLDYGTNANVTKSWNTFTLFGIKSPGDWEIARAGNINVPIDYGNFSYNNNLYAYDNNGANSRSWSTSVTVRQLDELGSASDYLYTTNAANVTIPAPTFTAISSSIPAFAANNYSLTLNYVSANSVAWLSSSSIYGGTSNWSSANRALSITGNATVIQDRLNHISYTPTTNLDESWVLYYSLYNPVSNFYSNVSQLIKSYSSTIMTRPDPALYDQNAVTYITTGPTIIDTTGGNPTYTVTISAASGVLAPSYGSTNPVYSLTPGGTGGTTSFNSSTRILTITGTKTQVNSRLANIALQPATDYSDSFYLTYALTSTAGASATKLQQFFLRNTSTGVSNTTPTRYFVSNTSNQTVFPNTVPQITETIGGNVYYSTFVTTTNQTLLSVVGDKAATNDLLTNLTFSPLKDVSGTQSLNILIQRGNVTLANQTVPFIGAVRSTAITGTGTYTFTTSQSFTLTADQSNYLTKDILIVSGGGGAGCSADTYYVPNGFPGAGGAGGVWAAVGYTGSLTGTLQIIVGAGGTGATAPGTNGASGGRSRIVRGTTDIAYVYEGLGGGGGSSYSGSYNAFTSAARSGGFYLNNIPNDGYALGYYNSSGNQYGGLWWHTGYGTTIQTSSSTRRISYMNGGGGGGALSVGGVYSSYLQTGTQGGTGMTPNDFSLVGLVPYINSFTQDQTIAKGGQSLSDGSDAVNWGSGGNGASSSGPRGGNGYQGIVIIRLS